MTRTGAALQSEEVDFLLNTDAAGGGSEGGAPENLEVTMRGDLEQISLADIFQTLAMSKMEGRLRVRNPLEQRDIFFTDGLVRNYVPARIETRRLGQRLVRANLVTLDQMRSLLLEQKKTRQSLNDLLVQHGVLDEMQVAEISIGQSAEDLYTLFTWTHGTFEFYKGACDDPVLQQRLEQLHRFEVNGLLLEVARRSDEWQLIIERLLSADEVPVVVGDGEGIEISETAHDVLQALDGTQSIRELADSSLLGLFDCARAVKELADAGIVSLCDDDAMVAIADRQIQRGDARRAVVTLQTLLERPGVRELETTERAAHLLQRSGESRLAAEVLVTAAHICDDDGRRLEMAREARRYDARSATVLAFLRDRLLRRNVPLDDELIEVSGDLADALADEGQVDEALAVVATLEGETQALLVALNRKARLLHRLGRADEAIGTLLELAEIHKADRRTDRLAATFEQILKIDYRRKDIAKALKQLHANRLQRHLKVIAVAALALAAAVSGLWLYQRQTTAARITALTELVQRQLAENDTAAAQSALAAAVLDLGEDELLEDLRVRIEHTRSRLLAEEKRRTEEDQQKRVAVAVDHVDRGEVQTALALHAELMAGDGSRAAIERAVKARLANLIPRLESLARDLPFLVPPPPDPLQTESLRRQALQQIADRFKSEDLAHAQGVLAARDDAALATLLGAADLQRIVQAASVVVQTFDTARQRQVGYEAALKDVETAQRLDPIFVAAREHAGRHEFEQALEAYRRLAAEYRGDDDLNAHIRSQVERHAAILRYLEVLRNATRDGDFATAQSQLRALKRTWPDIPFDKLTRLPLRVETTPPGADVRVDGQPIGKAPLRTEFTPGAATRIEVVLDGFRTEAATITGDDVSIVRSLLARTPQWTATLDGAVERQPAFDGERLIVTDRGGSITALRPATGTTEWRVRTNDLSALMPTPCLHGDTLLVASVDGTLRALDRHTGRMLWERDELPSELTPVVARGIAILATTDRRLVGLDPATGEPTWTAELPDTTRVAPCVIDGGALVVTATGTALCIRVNDGRELWRQRIGRTALGSPVAGGDVFFVSATEGTVSALRRADGARLWHRASLGEVTTGLACAGTRVFVPGDQQIHALRTGDGAVLARFAITSPPAADLTARDGRVWVGHANGIVSVLLADKLEPLHVLRGGRRAAAAPLVLPDGTTIAGFDDRSVQAFAPWR